MFIYLFYVIVDPVPIMYNCVIISQMGMVWTASIVPSFWTICFLEVSVFTSFKYIDTLEISRYATAKVVNDKYIFEFSTIWFQVFTFDFIFSQSFLGPTNLPTALTAVTRINKFLQV